MQLHPASTILFFIAVLLSASSRSGMPLFLCCGMLCLLASGLANSRFRLLLRRSRLLLLTALGLFGWLTPGTPLTVVPGATQEGLMLAAENLSRLLIALAMVAFLLTRLSAVELVGGLRSLLAPLGGIGLSPDRIAVRLALTLEQVEASRGRRRDDPDCIPTTLSLPEPRWRALDLALAVSSAALVLLVWLA